MTIALSASSSASSRSVSSGAITKPVPTRSSDTSAAQREDVR